MMTASSRASSNLASNNPQGRLHINGARVFLSDEMIQLRARSFHDNPPVFLKAKRREILLSVGIQGPFY